MSLLLIEIKKFHYSHRVNKLHHFLYSTEKLECTKDSKTIIQEKDDKYDATCFISPPPSIKSPPKSQGY